MPAPTTSNVARPSAAGYGVRINTRLFRLAAGPGRELREQSAPPQSERVNTNEVPEEFTDEYGSTFARSDFTGGEGLQWAHDRNNPPDASSRFWASEAVDVSPRRSGEQRAVRLSHTTENTLAGRPVSMVFDGESLHVVMDGDGYYVSSDPTGATPGWTELFSGADVRAVATLGSDVYVATTNVGIYRDEGTGLAAWSDLDATGAYGVKNRIVATRGSSIYEVVAAGAAPTALKVIDPDSEFTDVVDGGAAILAGATDGYVYAFTPSGTAGALELAAQDFFQDEQVTALAYAQGVIFVGTFQPTGVSPTRGIGRLWRCELSAASTLTNRQLIRQWGDEDTEWDRGVHAAHGSREAVTVAVKGDDGITEVWRYDLVTGGIHSMFEVGIAQNAAQPCIAVANDKVFVGGYVSSAVFGLFRETDTYEDEGWLIGPIGDFYSVADKTWVTAILDGEADDTGEDIELLYSTDPDAILDPDHASWTSVATTDGEHAMAVTSRYIVGQIRLTSDGTSTPEVRSFAFRAYPADYDVLVQMPINVSDRLERHNRRGQHIRGRGKREYEALREFEGAGVTIEVYELDLVARGQLVQIDTPVAALTERGSVTQFAMATFRGKRVAAGSSGSGDTAGTVGGAMVGALMVGGD